MEEGKGQLVTTIPGTSNGTSCTAWPSGREPLLKRGLALPGRFAGEEAFDANVFVEFFPVNAVPSADQAPVFAFCWCRVDQSREPGKRHGQTPHIAEFYGQCVFGNRHSFCRPHKSVLAIAHILARKLPEPEPV